MRRLLAALLGMVLLTSCSAGRDDDRPRVVVGAGSTTEQRVLAALTVLTLARAGLRAEVRDDLGGTVGLRREALAGGVDMFWDYTGAAWALGMGRQAPPSDPQASFERVRTADEDRGLTWLRPSSANATLALFVRTDDLPAAERPNGLGWLGRQLGRSGRRLCADPDFIRRPGGLESLAAGYGMQLQRVNQTAVPARENDAIAEVAKGRCFAALATATSGRARRAGLVLVADHRAVFPAFIVSPVARTDRLEQDARLAAALDPLAQVLDTERLAALNARAETGEDPRDIARDFLDDVLPRSRQ